jgi:3-hydroxy-9,10-secoandrosta-1,3,5(10)-triene-9,17-dione monooxygenase reductase component
MPLNADFFRSAMRKVPSPVTVVTASGGEEGRGVTIGSFTSLELEPPLISFNLTVDSRMYPVMLAAERFAVHILAADQVEIANYFARSAHLAESPLRQIPHGLEPDGLPILHDVPIVFLCERRSMYREADHEIVVGEVIEVRRGVDRPALIYMDGAYRSVGEEVPLPDFSDVNRGSRSIR